MSDEHGGACCEECAQGRKCAGDSCGLSKTSSTTVKGAMRVPSAFTGQKQPAPGGQGYVGASLGMGSLGQGYIGADLAGRPFTFGATPYPWNAAGPYLAPYWPLYSPWPGVMMPAGGVGQSFSALERSRMLDANKLFANRTLGTVGYPLAKGQLPIGVRPAGFAGTLTAEQRARMLAVLTPAQRTAYDAMTAPQKTSFESDFADAHWDVISGTSTTAQQAAQTQAYLGATEQALGLTFGTISTALANNNQQRLTEIRSQSDQRIAEINAQLQRDLAPTEATRLRYELASLQNSQMIIDRERSNNSRTLMYVGAGVLTLVVIGGVVYATRTRSNPVVGRGRNRHWEKPKRKSSKRSRSARA